MELKVNGKSRTVRSGMTANELIDHLELRGRRIAMELNGEILPRSLHAKHVLAEGDRIEIVHAVGGG